MKDCKFNILGAEWSMEFRNSYDDPSLKESSGYTDPSANRIVIAEREGDCELENFGAIQRRVIRHEIIHAYLLESGMSGVENCPVGVPETYVDWFATQAPKIFNTFAELDVLFGFSCKVTVTVMAAEQK